MIARRTRLAAVAAALAAALALTACSGGDAGGTTTAEGIVVDGTAVMAAEVEGPFGEAPTSVAVPPLAAFGADIERRTVIEGEGAPIAASDTVAINAQMHDVETGQVAQPYGYIGMNVALDDPSFAPAIANSLIGVPDGSRLVIAVPEGQVVTTAEGAAPALLMVLDVVTANPGSAAEGEPAEATTTAEYVTVSSEPGAQPEIEVHPAAPFDEPGTQHTDAVIVGAGPVVEDGDLVTVQYTGLLLEDGSEFDSSWTRGGTPASFPTDRVVTGFANALVGQTVGSRVVTVFSGDLGYGEQGSGSGIPGNATLIFVVDIVATL